MSLFGRAGQTASARLRRASGSAPGTELRTAGGLSRSVLWTASIVVCLVAASLLWLLTRPDGSGVAGPRGAGSPAQAEGGAGSGTAAGTVVSLTFNFGTVSQYDYARPLLRQHDMNGTFYVTPDRLDAAEGCCMSWQRAKQLYREGDEIGSFSADGVDLTVPWSADPAEDYARKKDEVCGAHERLVRLELDPRSFAYPAGAHAYDFPGLNRSLADLVASCGYLSGRSIGGLSADRAVSPVSSIALPPTEPYAVPTPDETGTGPITLAELQQAVAAAGPGDPGHWVPLVFGEVCHPGDPSYSACMTTWRPVEDTVLSEFLSWLDDAGEPGGAPAGTTVQTVREVMGAPPQPPLPPPATIVSFTFDDGDITQDLAGRILRAHGMQGTFYINTGPVDAGDPDHMTWAQVLGLHRDGNDIGGHTASHINLADPAIPDAVKRDEICRDHTRLQQMGLEPQSFAYPYGGLNEAAEELVASCGYASARSAGSVSPDGPVFAETVPPGDPFATMALDGPRGPLVEGAATTAPGTPLTLDYLQRAVVSAADNGGGWVQVVLHHVCVPDVPDFDTCMISEAPIDERTFSDFLDWLQHDAPEGTTVRTVRQVMESAR